MKAIEVAYASAKVGDIPIHSLELSNPTFPGGVFRLCSGFDDQALTLESGQTVTFTAAALGINLPQRALMGREDLVFALDNVTGETRRLVRSAINSGEPVKVVYRVYLSSDLTAPAEVPLRMEAVTYSDDRSVASISASFRNLMDRTWPDKLFTPDKFPGTRYA
ncbi:DUF1833 family protein [Photobacterium leiognathi]|uniref:DUF1833 family protein n=1 Tax=Photobacterium leiognathi TaxID=553611 RepID=UPI000D17A954|nr:DUF1833 family protein [Photobacterium leiognathi]PSW53063.1 hypothetical protein C0W50_19840 [Photobacterium leiognathi subsp. mandapamensis]